MLSQSSLRVFLVVFVLLLPISLSSASASNAGDLVGADVVEAEVAVGVAYEAVWAAEQVGADVSGLIVRLDDAGDLLADAYVAARLEDFDEASRLADRCSELVAGVAVEAEQLRLAALEVRTTSLWLTMVGSILGVVVVAVGGFLGWRLFKRRYLQRVLAMKPEVASADS